MLLQMLVQVVYIQHQVTGEDDDIVGQKYELPVISPIDDKGVFTEKAANLKECSYYKLIKPLLIY